MKNPRLIIFALLLACGTACQQKEILPEEPPVPEPEKKVVITASFAQANTRISYTEDPETHSLHQEWEIGDILFGFDDSSNPLTLEVTAVNGETGVATLGVAAGTLKLVGTDEERIYDCFRQLLEDPDAYAAMAEASNPYGDGYASRRIADILERELEE